MGYIRSRCGTVVRAWYTTIIYVPIIHNMGFASARIAALYHTIYHDLMFAALLRAGRQIHIRGVTAGASK
jgi:hypothetical protein